MCCASAADAQDTQGTNRTKVPKTLRGRSAQCPSRFATSRRFAADHRHARGNPDAASRKSTMRWTISMWSSHDYTITLHHVGLRPFRGCPLQKSHGNHDGERTPCCGGLRKTWYTIVKYGATDDELGQVGRRNDARARVRHIPRSGCTREKECDQGGRCRRWYLR